MNNNNNPNSEDLEFNSDTKSGPMRCRACSCSIFSLHKEQIMNEKTNTSVYELIAECCECYSYTIVSDLKERYNDSGMNSNNDNIISVQFKESQIIILDNCLDLLRKQFTSIVNDKTNTISEDERRKFNSKLTQVDQLTKMIKSTAHD